MPGTFPQSNRPIVLLEVIPLTTGLALNPVGTPDRIAVLRRLVLSLSNNMGPGPLSCKLDQAGKAILWGFIEHEFSEDDATLRDA